MRPRTRLSALCLVLALSAGVALAEEPSPDPDLPDDAFLADVTARMTNEGFYLTLQQLSTGGSGTTPTYITPEEAQAMTLGPPGVEFQILQDLMDLYNEVSVDQITCPPDSALAERLRLYLLTGIDPVTGLPPDFGFLDLGVTNECFSVIVHAPAPFVAPPDEEGTLPTDAAPEGDLPDGREIPAEPLPPVHLCYCDHQHGILDRPCYSRQFLGAHYDPRTGAMSPLGQAGIDLATALGGFTQAGGFYDDAAARMERVRNLRIVGGAFMGDYNEISKGLGFVKTTNEGSSTIVTGARAIMDNEAASLARNIGGVARNPSPVNIALTVNRIIFDPIFGEAFAMADRDEAFFDWAQQNLAQQQAQLKQLMEQLRANGMLGQVGMPGLVRCDEPRDPCWHWNFEAR